MTRLKVGYCPVLIFTSVLPACRIGMIAVMIRVYFFNVFG